MTEDRIKTQKININELNPAKYNPRTMPDTERKKLKKNLETFGLVDPIIIDTSDNNTIIGGHQRYDVLQEIDPTQELTLIKLGDIGLVLREMDIQVEDKKHQKALNLALNRINGDWDFGLLNDALEELVESHIDMDLTGFEDYEVIEYTLEDFDLDVLQEEEPDRDDELLSFEDGTDEEMYTATITFHNRGQREKFLQLIDRLQKEDKHQRTIAQLFTEYLNNHFVTSEEKIPEYTLLFENKEEKERYEGILRRVEESRYYQREPILGFVEEVQ